MIGPTAKPDEEKAFDVLELLVSILDAIDGGTWTIAEIADITGITEHHVFHRLARTCEEGLTRSWFPSPYAEPRFMIADVDTYQRLRDGLDAAIEAMRPEFDARIDRLRAVKASRGEYAVLTWQDVTEALGDEAGGVGGVDKDQRRAYGERTMLRREKQVEAAAGVKMTRKDGKPYRTPWVERLVTFELENMPDRARKLLNAARRMARQGVPVTYVGAVRRAGMSSGGQAYYFYKRLCQLNVWPHGKLVGTRQEEVA